MKVIPITIPGGFLIDGDDYPLILGRALTLSGNKDKNKCYVYVSGRGLMSKGRPVSLHRLIMGNPKGMQIDHINGDRLDNRKINLRTVTCSQNLRNMATRKTGINGVFAKSSKYKGVHFCKTTSKFIARILVNYKNIYVGCFDNEKDAAIAYDKKARDISGEYACLNFPEKEGRCAIGLS